MSYGSALTWEVPMRCAHCGLPVDPEDSFCRRCGVAIERHHLPTVFTFSLLPLPWSMARGPVLKGVTALAVGTAVELLRRVLIHRAASIDPTQALALLAGGGQPEGQKGRFPWSRAPKGEYVVTDTLVQVQRSVRFRR